MEFYAIADLSHFEKLKEELAYGEFFYNWYRPQGSLGGKTPSQAPSELSEKTPCWDEVIATYETKKERIQYPNYQQDLLLRKLKPGL